MKKIAFFLPTRRGSQRVKLKNTRPFAEVNGGLLALKMEQLLRVKSVDTIILSTNDPESIRIAERFHGRGKEIIIIERPDELASSETLVEDFIKYIPTIVSHDHIFWTHVTAPFVKSEIYEQAVEKYFEIIEQGFDSVLSVTSFQQFLWSEERMDIINVDRSVNKWPNTQDLEPLFEINHAFYINSRKNYIKYSDRIGQNPYLYKLNKLDSIDIDTEDEFRMAEAIFKAQSDRIETVSFHTYESISPTGPVTCFLPCRKGSERVKNKNIRPFAGYEKGLLEVKIKQLLAVEEFDEIVLSTNDEEIIDYARSVKDSRLRVDHRREELCRSETSTDDLIEYVPEVVKDGHVLWTHVTSPFVDSDDYRHAINLYLKILEEGYDSLMSVSKIQKFLFNDEGVPVNFNRDIEKWPRTQTIDPYYESNSGYFIGPVENYIKLNDRIGRKVYMEELDSYKSFDIDWEEDFYFAEKVFESKK